MEIYYIMIWDRLTAGQYCIVMIQENEDKSLTVLSATAFVVAEYELLVSGS